MRNNRRWTLLLAALLGVGGWAVSSQGQPDQATKLFMRRKLEHSQKVLEGIAVEDYRKIADNASAMGALSQAATWRVLPTPEYLRYSAEFQRLSDELARAANEKNLDRATLVYMQLTINCVNCHKHVRTVRTARLEPPDQQLHF